MRRVIATALFAVVSVAACAPTAGSSDRQDRRAQACFMPSQVNNFRQGDTQALYLRAGRQGVYEVQSAGCRNIDWANRLAVVPEIGVGGRICVGDQIRIVLAGGSAMPGDGPCRARVVRSLTEAEVEALPSRYRP